MTLTESCSVCMCVNICMSVCASVSGHDNPKSCLNCELEQYNEVSMRKKWVLTLFPFFIQSTETDGFYFVSFENYCIDQSEVWVNDQWLVKD